MRGVGRRRTVWSLRSRNCSAWQGQRCITALYAIRTTADSGTDTRGVIGGTGARKEGRTKATPANERQSPHSKKNVLGPVGRSSGHLHDPQYFPGYPLSVCSKGSPSWAVGAAITA